MPPHRHAYRPVVMGKRGAVTSAHPLASMAGIRVLLDGGNAVDAAVAVGAALNVVEPFMSSAGGIGLMAISRGGGRERHVLDFIGLAPAACRPEPGHRGRAGGRPQVLRHAGQPGGLARRARALRLHAARARASRPPSRWRRTACRSRSMNVTFFERGQAALDRSAEAQRLYLGNGGPRPGKVVTYKELAGTFRQVAEGGAEVFYRGPIAARHRARGGRGGRLAHRGGPRRVRARVAGAARHRLSGVGGLDGAPAVLGIPDARDAQHPRGL